MHDVDGLNAGYASALLEQYLENPDGVPDEWRALFESGASELVAGNTGLARLVRVSSSVSLPTLRESGVARGAAAGGRQRPRGRRAASSAARTTAVRSAPASRA